MGFKLIKILAIYDFIIMVWRHIVIYLCIYLLGLYFIMVKNIDIGILKGMETRKYELTLLWDDQEHYIGCQRKRKRTGRDRSPYPPREACLALIKGGYKEEEGKIMMIIIW
jgi:hypothetical protein